MFSVPTLSNELHGPQGCQGRGFETPLPLGQACRSGTKFLHSNRLFYSSLSVSRNPQSVVNSLQGLVNIRHLSSHLASIIPVTTDDFFSDVGSRNNFLRDGVVSPMPNPPLLPGLGTGWIYPDWTGYTQAVLVCAFGLQKNILTLSL